MGERTGLSRGPRALARASAAPPPVWGTARPPRRQRGQTRTAGETGAEARERRGCSHTRRGVSAPHAVSTPQCSQHTLWAPSPGPWRGRGWEQVPQGGGAMLPPLGHAVGTRGSGRRGPHVQPAQVCGEGAPGSLTCMSSTLPKKRPTGMGWLLSSSRKTLLSMSRAGAHPPRMAAPSASVPGGVLGCSGARPSSVSAERPSLTALG